MLLVATRDGRKHKRLLWLDLVLLIFFMSFAALTMHWPVKSDPSRF